MNDRDVDPHSPEWMAHIRRLRWPHSALERLLLAVAADEGDCWTFTGGRNQKGYGRITVDGWLQSAHRVSYALFTGPIPDGLTIDHLCGNRACVNPDHLEAVPHGVNVRRGATATKTHCKRGHLLSGPNLYRPPAGGRACRVCIADATRRWVERTGYRSPRTKTHPEPR